MKTIWKKRGKDYSLEELTFFKNFLKENELLCKFLLSRGFSYEEAKQYLDNDIYEFLEFIPNEDMRNAVLRIVQAVNKGERIVIYGDYDCDGSIGTALLFKYLKEIGANVDYYIPNRLEEGYGLNKEAIKKLAKEDTDIIITVDNGITALKEAELIKKLGIDLIITDHHEPLKDLPEAFATIDFKIDNDSEFTELCGAGVALLLIQALDDYFESPYFNFTEYAQLASISTIADIVPLKTVNRSLVKYAFETMNEDEIIHPGLKALVDVSEANELNSYNVGFRIAPMINAAGRLGQTDNVLELLTSKNPKRIKELAEILHQENIERNAIEKEVLKKALEKIEKEVLYKDDIIVVGGKDWHEGVIGIVASRIQEKWNKPVIVISFNDDNIGHGSCRSIANFNIFKALDGSGEFLEKYGGHEQAAGLTVTLDNLEDFKRKLIEVSEEQNLKELFTKVHEYDLEINTDELNLDTVKSLGKIQPTGVGNPGAVFKFNLKNIDNLRAIGKERNHLAFKVDNINALFFNRADLLHSLHDGPITILAKPQINCYNNTEKLQLSVVDIKQNPFENFNKALEFINNSKNGEEFFKKVIEYGYLKNIDRNLLVKIYNLAKSIGNRGSYVDQIMDKAELTAIDLALSLEILKEASLLDYNFANNIIYFNLIPTKNKKDLTVTKKYQLLQEALSFQN